MKKDGPKTCRSCSRWKEVKDKMRIAELLGKAAEGFSKEKEKGDFKPTLTEYLKLVQLQREFEEEEAREIKVTWVEPA